MIKINHKIRLKLNKELCDEMWIDIGYPYLGIRTSRQLVKYINNDTIAKIQNTQFIKSRVDIIRRTNFFIRNTLSNQMRI